MELFGDMIDAMKVRIFGNNRIAVEITGEQAEKADGHNKLTGRKNKTRRRRFIPADNQKFKKKIAVNMEEVADKFKVRKRGETDT